MNLFYRLNEIILTVYCVRKLPDYMFKYRYIQRLIYITMALSRDFRFIIMYLHETLGDS